MVSLVPSWTETLVECGVNVVGRTRFCIHPAGKVKAIPALGGTKDLKAEELSRLNPDLVILDREENPREFVEKISCPILDTHVDSLTAMARELDRLGGALENEALKDLADRARAVNARTAPSRVKSPVPGLIEELTPFDPRTEVTYVIWKNPWMAAGPGTYIHDVLQKLGFRFQALPQGKYPTLEGEDLRSRYCLFSSEPFPFAKKSADLRQEGWQGAIIDGEGYSWFGVRGIRFLETFTSSVSTSR